jgi:hypothetical protein
VNLDRLREGVEEAAEGRKRMMPEDREIVLALLDVAEAASRVTSYKVMGAIHIRAGSPSDFCDICDTCLRTWPCEGSLLSDALDRLREVTG